MWVITKKKKLGFTLVELLVVILILVTLSTISFLSLQSYNKNARDAKRLSDIKSLITKVEVEIANWKELEDLTIKNHEHEVIIGSSSSNSIQWVLNFDELWENAENFRDPLTWEDYMFAYTKWRTLTESNQKKAYSFYQFATISEKEKIYVIKWNYTKINYKTDSDSLFEIQTSPWVWYPIKNWDEIGKEAENDNWWWEEEDLNWLTKEWLHVDWIYIKDKNWEIVNLEWVSTHGLQWYSWIWDDRLVKYAKNELKMNTIRVTMYPWEWGYLTDPTTSKREATRIMDLALANWMYTIIDWHTWDDDYNPLSVVNEAKQFFDEISKEYANDWRVIYEITNEPRHSTTWSDIKQYAEQVIPVIRNNNPNAIVLVWTPNYSMDLWSASANPLSFDNIMYVYHFQVKPDHEKDLLTFNQWQANEYKDHLLQEDFNTLLEVRSRWLPIFVSEFSLKEAYNPSMLQNQLERAIRMFKNENINWNMWALSSWPDYAPEWNLLKPWYSPWTNITNYLTDAWNTVRNLMSDNYATNTSSTPAWTRVKIPTKWAKVLYAVSDWKGNTIPIPAWFYYIWWTKDTWVVISDDPNDKNKWVDSTNIVWNQYVYIPVSWNYEKYEWNEWTSISWTNDLTDNDLSRLKESVIKNDWFYVWRYEAVIPENMESWDGINLWWEKNLIGWLQSPRSKANAMPWNFTTFNNARRVSLYIYWINYEKVNNQSTPYIDFSIYQILVSDLMSSYWWDTMIKWIESTNPSFTWKWAYAPWIENTWKYSINNIYDIAWNLWEITTEMSWTNYIYRWKYDSDIWKSLKNRSTVWNNWSDYSVWFRLMLYVK